MLIYQYFTDRSDLFVFVLFLGEKVESGKKGDVPIPALNAGS